MSEETQSDGAMHKAFPCCPNAERMWEDKALLGPAKPSLIFILCLASSRPTLNTFEVLARLPLAGVLGGWPALQVRTPKRGKSSCWLSSPRTMGEVRDRVRATASPLFCSWLSIPHDVMGLWTSDQETTTCSVCQTLRSLVSLEGGGSEGYGSCAGRTPAPVRQGTLGI